jgi:hypothetical protein
MKFASDAKSNAAVAARRSTARQPCKWRFPQLRRLTLYPSELWARELLNRYCCAAYSTAGTELSLRCVTTADPEGGHRVLIVEDDWSTRWLIANAFQRKGLESDVARLMNECSLSTPPRLSGPCVDETEELPRFLQSLSTNPASRSTRCAPTSKARAQCGPHNVERRAHPDAPVPAVPDITSSPRSLDRTTPAALRGMRRIDRCVPAHAAGPANPRPRSAWRRKPECPSLTPHRRTRRCCR